MNITVNFECLTHHVSKDGTIPLSFRICINRKNHYLGIGQRIKVGQYDKEAKQIKKGIKGHMQLTSKIARERGKVDTIIDELRKREEVITFPKIKKEYQEYTGKAQLPDFYTYVEEELKRERNETEIKESSATRIEKEMDRIKAFSPKLQIHEIDARWLGKFNEYLLKRYAYNTRYNTLSAVRKYVNRLHKAGIIKKYPFAEFEVGQPALVDVAYLEPEELSRLHTLFDNCALLNYVKKAKNKYAQDFHVGLRYQNTLHYLLISCYSGLRHSDIKTLRREHIQGDFIVKKMEKDRMGRKKTVRIPIRQRLKSLLNMNSDSGFLFELPVTETSATNKYIKEIFNIANIDKHFTFHGCRHTFAINSLLLGIKIEVVSDVLGHSEITTTQRYARVVDRLREKEMNKWDNFSKIEKSVSIREELDAKLHKLDEMKIEMVLTYVDDLLKM